MRYIGEPSLQQSTVARNFEPIPSKFRKGPHHRNQSLKNSRQISIPQQQLSNNILLDQVNQNIACMMDVVNLLDGGKSNGSNSFRPTSKWKKFYKM